MERDLGEPLDHLRHILGVSIGAFRRYVKIMPLTTYRDALPVEPFHVARIVATRHHDCGTCVQTVVNYAKKDGVPIAVLRATVDGEPDALPEELAEIYRFTEAVVKATYDEEPLRERIRKRYGEQAFVELAIAIGATPYFPLTKRALGFGVTCAKVVVAV
ncbi:MAG: hypothetical protein ACHREM_13315 [Polyangiales bacterium]